MFNRKKATDLPVPSWKKKIDDLEFKKTQEEQRRLQQQKDLKEAKERAYLNQEKNELYDKIRILGQNFQCHVCGVNAKKPAKKSKEVNIKIDGFPTTTSVTVEDWDSPGDLWKCSICQEWTCKDCLHKGICKTCADKLP